MKYRVLSTIESTTNIPLDIGLSTCVIFKYIGCPRFFNERTEFNQAEESTLKSLFFDMFICVIPDKEFEFELKKK